MKFSIPGAPIKSSEPVFVVLRWRSKNQSQLQTAVGCRPADRPQPYLTSISFPTATPTSSRWPGQGRNTLLSTGYTSSCLKSRGGRERQRHRLAGVDVRISAINHLGFNWGSFPQHQTSKCDITQLLPAIKQSWLMWVPFGNGIGGDISRFCSCCFDRKHTCIHQNCIRVRIKTTLQYSAVFMVPHRIQGIILVLCNLDAERLLSSA